MYLSCASPGPTPCNVVVRAVDPSTPGQMSSRGVITTERKKSARQNPMRKVPNVIKIWNPQPASNP